MATPQTYKNHMKLDPLHHFIIMPLLFLNFAFSFVLYSRHHHEHPQLAGWWIIVSITLLLLGAKMRLYSLGLQNRIIRLEERLRLTTLLPAAEHAAISSFTTGQLIALRFASDAELPALARRTLAENLNAKQIKQSILTWRPDYQRV